MFKNWILADSGLFFCFMGFFTHIRILKSEIWPILGCFSVLWGFSFTADVEKLNFGRFWNFIRIKKIDFWPILGCFSVLWGFSLTADVQKLNLADSGLFFSFMRFWYLKIEFLADFGWFFRFMRFFINSRCSKIEFRPILGGISVLWGFDV